METFLNVGKSQILRLILLSQLNQLLWCANCNLLDSSVNRKYQQILSHNIKTIYILYLKLEY
jgi:hypothetical protein